MRSESTDPNVMNTTAVMSPQVFEIVNNGDVITGPGLTTTIFTNCSCTAGNTVANLMTLAPILTNTTATRLLSDYNSLPVIGFANRIDFDNTTVTITTLFAQTAVCGGVSPIFIPMCTTTLSDHFFANVAVSYMSDMSGSTVTQNTATIISVNDRANMTWVSEAMKHILEGPASAHLLAPTIPGLMSPLLWWTTSGIPHQYIIFLLFRFAEYITCCF